VLSAAEALTVLDALRASALYRPDQNSYLLYPARRLPAFLDKNRVPRAAVQGSRLLAALLDEGNQEIVARDADGSVRFNASFRNAQLLAQALDSLAAGPHGPLVRAERTQILAVYEQVFDHRAFTGRSGTFYKYEGLGCIYWHMVSKLLVAVGEVLESAGREAIAPSIVDRLRAHYDQIRDGLGAHKTPAVYGAFPIDPYSHTPAFAGVQQPGMTGQVKEDILTRRQELGVVVQGGRLHFRPDLFRREELSTAPSTFHAFDVTGKPLAIAAAAGTVAFTVCQVPVVIHGAGPAGVFITDREGAVHRHDSLALDPATSAAIFARTGAITRLDVHLDLTHASQGGLP
jgi:hypothetical protein